MSKLPKLKLYWNIASPPSRALKSLLIAGGVPHEEQHVDISKGEQKSEEILKLNPNG